MNIDKEILDSEAFLKGFNKSPFKIPNGYLDDLYSEISTKLTKEQFPNTPGFVVPTDYIKNFTVAKPKHKIIKLLGYISVAAMTSFGVFVFQNQKNSSNYKINHLSEDEIINYLSQEENITTEFISNNIAIESKQLTEIHQNLNTNELQSIDIEINEEDQDF